MHDIETGGAEIPARVPDPDQPTRMSRRTAIRLAGLSAAAGVAVVTATSEVASAAPADSYPPECVADLLEGN